MTNPKRFLCMGIGGKRCSCCFPAPRSKARKGQYRHAKLVSRREAKALICEAASERK